MRLINLISVSPSTTYYISNALSEKVFIIREYGQNKAFVYNKGGVNSGSSFTTQSNTYYISVTLDIPYSEYDETTAKVFMCLNSITDKTYEPYVKKGIYVDNEEFFGEEFGIKKQTFSSITTSSTGYYALGMKSTNIAIVGFKHTPIANGTKLEIFSDVDGNLFIRSYTNNAYGTVTINNLIVYYI